MAPALKIRVHRCLAALSLGFWFATAPTLAAGRVADPALWVVRDADTTLYLFGTAHVLPKDLVWFDKAVARAFQASAELVLELLPQDNPTALAPRLLLLALDPGGRTMAQRLGPEEHAAYVKLLDRIGLPAALMEPMEPWFVSVTAAALIYGQAGLDASSGSEAVLARAARRAGKPITALETPEQQLSTLDAMPEAEQLASLRKLIQNPDQALARVRQMVEHWARGDMDQTAQLLNETMAGAPQTTRLLLRERNIRWTDQLKERMGRPGVVFVAVGAGHMSGPDNLRDLLMRAGFRVERMRP
jgi:uncharacterized protein YbaP (TraB family)